MLFCSETRGASGPLKLGSHDADDHMRKQTNVFNKLWLTQVWLAWLSFYWLIKHWGNQNQSWAGSELRLHWVSLGSSLWVCQNQTWSVSTKLCQWTEAMPHNPTLCPLNGFSHRTLLLWNQQWWWRSSGCSWTTPEWDVAPQLGSLCACVSFFIYSDLVLHFHHRWNTDGLESEIWKWASGVKVWLPSVWLHSGVLGSVRWLWIYIWEGSGGSVLTVVYTETCLWEHLQKSACLKEKKQQTKPLTYSNFSAKKCNYFLKIDRSFFCILM